jgi:chemotaxis protein MotB
MQRRSPSNEEGWLLSYADLITNLLIFFAMMLGAAEVSRSRMQEIARELSGQEAPQSLASIQAEIEAQVKREGLQDAVRTQLTDDGLKVSLNSGLMFDSGRAVIRDDQLAVLDRMLATLVPYGGRYDFAIEGHTDATPFVDPAGTRTNWELSTDRAHAVRARLEAVGLTGKAIRVEGYADSVPLPPEALVGLDDAERLALHRRVIVRVY